MHYLVSIVLSGSGYINLKEFLNNFSFNAIQFKASYFADVSNNWEYRLVFKECGEQLGKNKFKYKCTDIIDGKLLSYLKRCL